MPKIQLISHKGEKECLDFFEHFFTSDKKVLFIGTLGFNDACLYFPGLMPRSSCIDYLFLVEQRPEVPEVLHRTAQRNKKILEGTIVADSLFFAEIRIVAEDTANVAGRNATLECSAWLKKGYTDVVVDATTMSRGVCFPIVRQAFEYSKLSGGPRTHVVIADRTVSSLDTRSMSSDTPQYMHGFQADMDTDSVKNALKLWLPQLSENNLPSLERIFRHLQAEEVSPILPFPAANPRRGDDLLREFQGPILSDWDVNLLDLIYAHESDPTDVFETIKRIHLGRGEALSCSKDSPPRTILSPAGSKMGSLGMLFAAIELDLPVIYSETMGYQCGQTEVPPVSAALPDCMWHAWLRPV